MSGSIYTRINSLLASNYLLKNLWSIQNDLYKQQEIASTSKKVNKASDAPASYYMIRQYDKRISNLDTKQTSYENSINLLQKNDSYLDQIASALAEMSSLANEALNVSATTAEKAAIQEDINQLRDSISSTLSSGVDSLIYTGFSLGGLQNAKLDGTATDSAQPTLAGLTLDGLNLNVTGSTSDINQTITNLDTAYDLILKDEGKLGSYIKRLDYEKDLLDIEQTNYESSKSTLEDADAAETELEIVRLNILQNTTLSLIAQANSYYQTTYSLLINNNS